MANYISVALFPTLLLLISFLVVHLAKSDEQMNMSCVKLFGQGITTMVLSSSSKTNAESPPPQNIDCGGACDARCALSSRPKLCKRACGTCCAWCDCVPPGTSGNYDACPCYAYMTTHGGRRKCP